MIFYLYSKNKLTPDFEAVTKVSAGHRIYLYLVIVSLKTCGLERREKCFPEEQTTISWLKAWIAVCYSSFISGSPESVVTKLILDERSGVRILIHFWVSLVRPFLATYLCLILGLLS